MTSGALWGWVGGIAGSVIGLAGGLFGAYCSIRNTQGPRERAFMIKFSAGCLAAVAFFLGLLFVLPNPFRWLLWIPYGILLPLGIRYGNRRQQDLRREEAGNRNPRDGEAP